MSSIAIITARGGSKRIPKKNIKEFCGKPIIAYSIEAAVKSNIFDEVMVSTDSEEIAEIAKQYGADVPFLRSDKTSNDFATTSDVIKEVLDNYLIYNNRTFDSFCCIYPTAPFITASKLISAYEALIDNSAGSVVPVVKFDFPPQRGLIICDGKIEYRYPEFANLRSQDLEPLYHDCGQFYFCNTKTFLSEGSIISSNTVPIVMPEEEVQDIDNPSDWIQAEIKYRTFIDKMEK